MKNPGKAFERLLRIMDELREKCPWDRKQTMQSLRQLSIEELYELSDAILDNDSSEIKSELGDLMLHLVFYAKIASEKNQFDIEDVLDGICEKLIYRHPHIYGNVTVENEEDVKRNWEQLKLKEGKRSVLQGVPPSLPAMVKAFRIQEKAAGIGFDWNNAAEVWEKVKEELEEFHVEVKAFDSHQKNSMNKISNLDASLKIKEKMEAEFGDVLFALINYGKFLKINAEDALEKTNRKFISRFKYVETRALEEGIPLDKDHMTQMDAFWNEARKNL